MRALILKEFRELLRDHRTLAMLIALPVVLLIVFGYAANFTVDKVSVIIVGDAADSLRDELAESDVAVDDLTVLRTDPAVPASSALDDATGSPSETKGEADGAPAGVTALLRDQEADAVIIALGGDPDDPLPDRMRVYVDGSSLFTAQAAQGVFVQLAAEDARNRVTDAEHAIADARAEAEQAEAAFADFGEALADFHAALVQALSTGGDAPTAPEPPAGVSAPELPEITAPALDPDELVTVLFNPELQTSWVMIPGLIGLILLFIGALITSIGLVRERESGTLEQLAVMPIRPSELIVGKITPYFLLALLDMAAVSALGVWLFGVPFTGSLWLFSAAAIVFLFVVLGIGVFISSVSQNTGQAIQLAILFIVPQVLLSGLIFPLDSMPAGVRWIGYALPLTWFREIAQGVMLRDAGVTSLWLPFAVLSAMAVIAFGAATARMRFTLTHGGAR